MVRSSREVPFQVMELKRTAVDLVLVRSSQEILTQMVTLLYLHQQRNTRSYEKKLIGGIGTMQRKCNWSIAKAREIDIVILSRELCER